MKPTLRQPAWWLAVLLVALGMMALGVAPMAQAAGWHQTAVIGTPLQPAQLVSPNGLAAAPDGTLYVSDLARHVIVAFAPNGTARVVFGGGGSQPGDLQSPGQIARAPDGTLYVTDNSNNRVVHLGPSGALLGIIGELGSGNGNGQFDVPAGVAVAADGIVYVADSGNNRIQRFTAQGAYLDQWGATGVADGQLRLPRFLDIAPNGNVYVADTNNSRVQYFTPTGAYLGKWGSSGAANGQFQSILGVSVAPSGDVYTSDRSNGVQRFTAAGVFVSKPATAGTGVGQLDGLAGIEVGSDGAWYTAEAAAFRVQRFTSGDLPDHTISDVSMPQGLLRYPRGAAQATDGTLYVVDTFSWRVQVFDRAGAPSFSFGTRGNGNGQFQGPYAVTLSPDESEIYVLDGARLVQVFDRAGNYLRRFGTAGTLPGQMSGPVSISAAANGNLWIADSGGNRIQSFSPTGTFLVGFGSAGSGPGQFDRPYAVAVDPLDGSIWTAEHNGRRVQHFTGAGSFLGTFGSAGSGPAQFAYPHGLAFTSRGTLLVADSWNSRVQELQRDGTFLREFGAEGQGFEQMAYVKGVHAAPDGTVVAIDAGNQRVLRWAWDDQAPTGVGASYTSGFAHSRSISVAFEPGNDHGGAGVTSTTLERSDGVLAAGACDFGATGWTAVTVPPGSVNVTDVPAADGCYRYRVTSTDRVGNAVTVENEHTVMVDTSSPSVTVPRSLRAGGFASPTLRSMRIATSDAGSGIAGITARFRNRTWTLATGVLDLTKLPEGRGTLHVVVTDLAGNVRTFDRALGIDRTAPRVQVLDLRASLMQPSVRLRVSDSMSGVVGSGVQLAALPLLGRNVVTVHVFDRAGNSATRRLVVQRHLSLARPELNRGMKLTAAQRDEGGTLAQQMSGPHSVFHWGDQMSWYPGSPQSELLVREVEWRLRAFHYLPAGHRIDGEYDIDSIRAIQRFQSDHGLPVLGTVGPRTRAALDARLMQPG